MIKGAAPNLLWHYLKFNCYITISVLVLDILSYVLLPMSSFYELVIYAFYVSWIKNSIIMMLIFWSQTRVCLYFSGKSLIEICGIEQSLILRLVMYHQQFLNWFFSLWLISGQFIKEPYFLFNLLICLAYRCRKILLDSLLLNHFLSLIFWIVP